MISASRHESRRGSFGSVNAAMTTVYPSIHPSIHRQINSIPIGISKPRILRKLLGTSTAEVHDFRRLSDPLRMTWTGLGISRSASVSSCWGINARANPEPYPRSWVRGYDALVETTSLNEARLESQNCPHVQNTWSPKKQLFKSQEVRVPRQVATLSSPWCHVALTGAGR